MAQKFKPTTRIPSAPKPTLLKSVGSTFNLNAGIGNTGIRAPKPLTTRAPHLRRSKSITDFRSLHTNTKSNFNVNNKPASSALGGFTNNKPASSALGGFARKPLKRPALTDMCTVVSKISKEPKTEPVKPSSKSVQPRIAPYDFKGRYYHLKEIHEKLKVQYRELKERTDETGDQYEDLLAKSKQQEDDFDSLKELHEKLKKDYRDMTEQKETITSQFRKLKSESDEQFRKLESELDELKTELNEKTLTLDCTTKELEDIKEIHSTINSKLSSAEKELDANTKTITDLKEDLRALSSENRKHRNTIQELKGNIRVFCRIRPPLPDEKDKPLYGINILDENSIEMYRSKEKKMEFSFDQVFGTNSSQESIFEELSQLVQSSLDGYNVCVFAYGQTGSGKTYTMEGEYHPSTRGMIPRAIDTIFYSLESLKRLGWIYKIKTSFLEIYNETVVDLLAPKKGHLDIRMCDAKGTDVYVPNLTIEDINSADKLISLMTIAQRNRAVAATENNERSSRSHSVTKISLEGINEELAQKCMGNLNLIDLAGSEKFHTNETTRLRETTNINKSLSNLSNVILCLVKKTSHIPYRNSKLTHLLMPSLGGNSKTLMLVNISPLDDCYNESLNSLRFASTVNQCKTGLIKKQKTQT